MPSRSKVLQLPEPVRAELDRKLIASGFSDYPALADWLAQQGFEIGKSSIHRYGQEFEDKLAALRIATQQAQAIGEAVEDDGNALGDALVRLAQQKAFDVLMQYDCEDREQAASFDLAKISRAIADLNRSAVQQKKWQIDLRKQVADVASAVTSEVKERGLGDQFAEQIRAKILGIGT